jgi:xanthine dehydrogenase YagS FAD-binding subunit
MREFVLERAGSAVEAIGLNAAQTSADAHVRSSTQYLAGGTTLFDLMKLQVMNPARLIDISGLRAEHGRILELEDGL